MGAAGVGVEGERVLSISVAEREGEGMGVQ